MKCDATFSPCQLYRYTLLREWNTLPHLVWIMLNPSTADSTRSDPTVTRCLTRSINYGYGGIEVLNLFAYRSTDPRNLKKVADPVGPGNNAAITESLQGNTVVIAAWGCHGTYRNRDKEVLQLIAAHGCKVFCLGTDQHGNPRHPLHVAYKIAPTEFKL